MVCFKYLCGLLFLMSSFAAIIVAAPQSSRVDTNSSPNAVLCSAQTIFIRTKSVYFKPAALEEELLDREEFQQRGFVISREESDAELIIEVDRKLFTNIFVYSVIDKKNERVLLAGKINSLGGMVEGKITNGFIKRLQRACSSAPDVKTK